MAQRQSHSAYPDSVALIYQFYPMLIVLNPYELKIIGRIPP